LIRKSIPALRCAIVLLAFFLGGCSSPPVTGTDLAGVWLSADGAELHFEADGKFSATRLEMGHVVSPDRMGKSGSGTGRWKIAHQASRELGDAELDLHFDSGNDFPYRQNTLAYISGSGVSMMLYFGLSGEPAYIFRKGAPPPPS
jgi:hypothetical protein